MSNAETPPPGNRRTRYFLVAMVVLALTLAVGTIVGSLRGWQEEDRAPVENSVGNAATP
jgi:hypothetical protein